VLTGSSFSPHCALLMVKGKADEGTPSFFLLSRRRGLVCAFFFHRRRYFAHRKGHFFPCFFFGRSSGMLGTRRLPPPATPLSREIKGGEAFSFFFFFFSLPETYLYLLPATKDFLRGSGARYHRNANPLLPPRVLHILHRIVGDDDALFFFFFSLGAR